MSLVVTPGPAGVPCGGPGSGPGFGYRGFRRAGM